MPVIKIGGSKTTAKKTAAKPAAKRGSTARKSTTTAKRTTAKRTATKPKPARKAAGPRGPRTPKTDPKLLKRHVTALESAGNKRQRAEEMHQEAVEAVHEAAQAALADEVPMTLISEKLGVSRQWLYKMGEFRSRTNGNGNGRVKKPRATAAASKTVSRRNGKTASTRKPAAKKPAAKRSGTRVRIGRK